MSDFKIVTDIICIVVSAYMCFSILSDMLSHKVTE